MRKRICTIVVVMMMLFTACSEAKEENPYGFDTMPQDTTNMEQITSSTDATEPTTEVPKTTEGLSMKYYTAGEGMAEKLGVDKTLVFVTYDLMIRLVDPIVYETFNELLVNKYGCDFVVEFRGYDFVQYEELYQKEIRNMKELGEQTDILCIGQTVNTTKGDTYANAIEDGLLEPLGMWFETEWGKVLKESYPDIYWARFMRDGECYGKGLEYSTCNPAVLLINKEYVTEENDVKKIKTFDDIIAFLDGVENVGEDMIPLAVSYSGAYNKFCGYYDFFSEHGINAGICAREKNGKWEAFFKLQDEEYLDNLFKIRNYGLGGKLAHGKAVNEGKFVVAIDKIAIDDFNDNLLKIEDGKGTSAYMNVSVGNIVEGWYEHIRSNVVGIASWSEYKEEALQLLALMHSEPELSNLLAYGLEGIHYNVVDGIVKKGDKFSDVGMLWTLNMANPIITYPVGLETTDKEKRYLELASEARLGIESLYNIDMSAYKDVLEKMDEVMKVYDGVTSKDVSWLYKENYMELLEEARKQMKELGIDEIVAEINRQLEEAQK